MKKLLIYLFLYLSFITCHGQAGTYINPISDTLFAADPFVLFHDGVYYLYATSAGDGFKYWTSKDLVNWESKGYAFKKIEDSWGKGSFWAPEVVHFNDQFYLIYSSSGETMYGKGLRICIDGHIFVDSDGKPYLYYEMVGAVGEHWKNKGFLWGIVMGVELSADLSTPQHEPKLCLYPSQDWEGTRSMKARSNEGMTVFKKNGIYYMTYSGNHYADPNYGIGYAVSDKPLGMWVKYEGNPILKRDLTKGVSGPGHNSIIQSPDMKEWFIVYHSHADPDKPSGIRVLNIDRLIFNNDSSLSVIGPTRTPQPMPSGSF